MQQFERNNPSLPRRVDDASVRASQFDRGGPIPPQRTLAGKVLPTAVIDTPIGDAADIPGRGENLSPTRFRY